MLLFREATTESKAVIKLPVQSADAKILASNDDAKIKIENGFVYAEFTKPRSYAFVKLN